MFSGELLKVEKGCAGLAPTACHIFFLAVATYFYVFIKYQWTQQESIGSLTNQPHTSMPKKSKSKNITPFPPHHSPVYYKKKPNHFLSLWLEDNGLKARLQEAAKAEGRSLNNFVNTYIAPEMEAVLIQKEMSRTQQPFPKTASQKLAEAAK